jgi:hypothetical protein
VGQDKVPAHRLPSGKGDRQEVLVLCNPCLQEGIGYHRNSEEGGLSLLGPRGLPGEVNPGLKPKDKSRRARPNFQQVVGKTSAATGVLVRGEGQRHYPG